MLRFLVTALLTSAHISEADPQHPLLEPVEYATRRLSAIHSFSEERKTSVRPILSLLAESRHTSATDPRDKIFAMLALGSDLDGPLGQFVPNYSVSARFVYTDFALWRIGTHQSLDILSHCTARKRDFIETNTQQGRITTSIGGQPSVQSAPLPYGTALGLPSWVPNWSRSVSHQVMPKYHQEENATLPPLFHASGQYWSAVHVANK